MFCVRLCMKMHSLKHDNGNLKFERCGVSSTILWISVVYRSAVLFFCCVVLRSCGFSVCRFAVLRIFAVYRSTMYGPADFFCVPFCVLRSCGFLLCVVLRSCGFLLCTVLRSAVLRFLLCVGLRSCGFCCVLFCVFFCVSFYGPVDFCCVSFYGPADFCCVSFYNCTVSRMFYLCDVICELLSRLDFFCVRHSVVYTTSHLKHVCVVCTLVL